MIIQPLYKLMGDWWSRKKLQVYCKSDNRKHWALITALTYHKSWLHTAIPDKVWPAKSN